MINAGGKTNGYSVPNPIAQFQLVAEALKRAGVNPRTVSYIEAHGTGTVLGDPIEISGLSRAFEQNVSRESYSSETGAEESRTKQQYCAVGSVKSNIGHLESAAGIAGLTKILLQLKHGQIVPSLHSRVLNPNIDFSATPFIVNQKLRDWDRPVIEGKAAPRIAGISSFGAGGSNAHVILEEYQEPPAGNNKSSKSYETYVIVLSTKNEDRLKEAVKNLYEFINHQIINLKSEMINLNDMAYTLQVGRAAMEHRLGFIVNSEQQLQERLGEFLAAYQTKQQDNLADVYLGQVKHNNEFLSAFKADEDLQTAMKSWVSKGKLRKLLEFWIKGVEFDWDQLYRTEKPRRISLPTYPFARERYWVDGISVSGGVKKLRARKKFVYTNRPDYSSIPTQATTKKALPGVQTSSVPESTKFTESRRVTRDRKVSLRPVGLNQVIIPDPVHPAKSSVQVPQKIHLSLPFQHPEIPLSQSERDLAPGSNPLLTPFVPAESLQKELCESLGEALYMNPSGIDIDKEFITLGLDSVVGVEWIRTVNKQYGTNIGATKLYDYSCIRKLAEFIAKQLNKRMPGEERTTGPTATNEKMPFAASNQEKNGFKTG